MNLRHAMKGTALLVLLAAVAWMPAGASEPDETAQQAYKLRMDGKAGEAKALLEQAASEHPQDAAVRFELARTHLYLATGDPPQLAKHLEDAQAAIAKAVELEPDNAAYALFEGHVAFFRAYMSLKDGGAGAKEKFAAVCAAFERAVQNKPGYAAPMLYLVEIYGSVPPDMGGDKAKAAEWAAKLDAAGAVWAAKARSILLPDDADRVAYWETVLQEHENDADVLEELGKACIYSDKVDEGIKHIEEAVKADPRRKTLILDLARVHILRVMQGAGEKGAELAAAQKAAERYLETDPPVPLKAYTLGLMSKIQSGLGDSAAAAELQKKAAALDPAFSKASAIPGSALFLPPDQAPAEHKYLFRPL